MQDNFELFEKYPHCTFNFSGANRYRLMKEYFPADFEKVKKYVDEGRWFPAGSSMEEGDVNTPSAEAIIRQILYRECLVPPRIWQSRRRIHVARLLRFSVFLADHPGAFWRGGILNAEVGMGFIRRRRRYTVT